MDLAAVRSEFERFERVPPSIPGMVREDGARTVRFVSAGAGRGTVLRADLDAETADAAIEAEIERFRQLGQVFEWKHYDDDRPADLAARLEAHGFLREPDETVMVFDLSRTVDAPADVSVRPVTERAAFDEVFAIQRAAFGRGDRGRNDQLADACMSHPDQWTVFVAYVDGEAAAVGALRRDPGSPFASLWAGGTVPHLRRRGAYLALVSARLARARSEGRTFAYVDAGAESRPILERIGFQVLVGTRPFAWHPVG